MQRLADVELQLIMHGLECEELLHFARCSQQILHAADATFAWRHAILPQVYPPSDARFPRPSRLLRHVTSISVRLAGCADLATADDALGLVSFYSGGSLCRNGFDGIGIVSLDASALRKIRFAAMEQLVAAPILRDHLRSYTDGNTSLRHAATNLRLLCTLPHLQRLHLRDYGCHLPIEAIVAAPTLTALTFYDTSSFQADARMFQSVTNVASTPANSDRSPPPNLPALLRLARCTHLTELAVSAPYLYGACFLAFCTAPHMARGLRSLHLDYFSASAQFDSSGELMFDAPSAEDYLSGFAALSSLHTLRLTRIDQVDLLLPGVALAPALRFLHVDALEESEWPGEGHVPSIGALLQLLADAPNLAVTLTLPVDPDPTRQRMMGAVELLPFGTRFQLL